LLHYPGKNEITLSRDLEELERLKLIERSSEGYRAKTEVVLAYMPPAQRLAKPD